MTLKALLYAYILGGITFIPLVLAALVFFTIYTSVPVGDPDVAKKHRGELAQEEDETPPEVAAASPPRDVNDQPKSRKGWLTMRRTFEESAFDGGYVTLVRSFLDSRSKDPKRSRPKDMWYVVLKGTVLYLYEDEGMSECGAVIELGGHDVTIYPEGLLDGELFAKRNAICLKPKPPEDRSMPSVTKEMKMEDTNVNEKVEEVENSPNRKKEKEREKLAEMEKKSEAAREEAHDTGTPWFIFVRSNFEMEDWYFSLIHASDHPTRTPTLHPLQDVFLPSDMNNLVSTLDEQPDVIPMRWLNALIGRIFYSFYRTEVLEASIIARLMKKISKVKRPAFLDDIVVKEVSFGNKTPVLSKPMLKELTKEGDASMEVHIQYKGEIRITVEATATINLGARFGAYTVRLVLAAVLKELEGNLLVKVKRPPSNRIWYAFTQTPRMVLEVEPIVSDRQITWGMILSTIESRLKEIIQESVVMPNMDDIAFFESSPYEHRGGIWSDAVRRVREPSVSGEEKEKREELASSASDTAIATDSTPDAGDSAPVPKSQSAYELSTSSTPSSSPPNPSISEDASRHTRNRSWFSSVRSEDANALAGKYDDEGEENVQRGRTTEVDKSSVARSQSTPDNPEAASSRTNDPDLDAGEDTPTQDLLFPSSSTSSTRRSSSQHSSRGGYASSEYDDPFASEPSTPSKTTNPPRTNNPSTFLSTLKSRAGDKEALSKSAKEAMRKWGVNVNWGPLRKESNSGEEMPDHGAVGSRLRTESMNNLTQKARTSYAEVRAAVAERKGKGNQGEGSSDPEGSLPIPIPDSPSMRGKQRTVSGASSTSRSYGSTLSRSISNSTSSSGKPNSVEDVPPSISRTNTESEAPDGLVPGVSTPGTPFSPIHVQPKAKMMTIPGIHASHRGEVMSMGYSAPQPPATPADNKVKNSVYRLWKSPVLAGQQQDSSQASSQASSSSSQSSASLDTVDGNKDKERDVGTPAPLDLSLGSPLTSPRPTPPPLPPRKTPISVSRPLLEPSIASESPQLSASEKLKSIATKDDNTRVARRVSLEVSHSRRTSSGSQRSRNSADVPTPENVGVVGGEDSSKQSDDPPADSETPTASASATPPALPPRVQASA